MKIFLVQSCFDGQKHYAEGPYTIITESVERGQLLLSLQLIEHALLEFEKPQIR